MMKQVRRGAKRILAVGAFAARNAGANIVLLVLAGVMIGFGFYFKSRPAWATRSDIREYNAGVTTYQNLLWGPLVSTEESLISVYPHVIERAGGSFDSANSQSTDKELKSLACYNLGTLIGRAAFFSVQLPGIDLGESLTKLGEAIRDNPNNEDAKYNYELLERRIERKKEGQAGPGPGYGAGIFNKGY
jgi:hypothetical protein